MQPQQKHPNQRHSYMSITKLLERWRPTAEPSHPDDASDAARTNQPTVTPPPQGGRVIVGMLTAEAHEPELPPLTPERASRAARDR